MSSSDLFETVSGRANRDILCVKGGYGGGLGVVSVEELFLGQYAVCKTLKSSREGEPAEVVMAKKDDLGITSGQIFNNFEPPRGRVDDILKGLHLC
jgi:hypothetical protein